MKEKSAEEAYIASMKTHFGLIDRYALFDLLGLVTASQIVKAWTVTRHARSSKTEAKYAGKAIERCQKYADLCDCQLSDLTPRMIVACLFDDSARMKSSAWMTYRSALLHHLASTRAHQLSLGLKVALYTQALAALVIVNKPPKIELRLMAGRLPERSVSISMKRIDTLFTWLREHPSKFSAAAEVFATATLITGLRPCEWPSVEVVESSADVDVDESELGIAVQTGKRKADEPAVVRTLWITTTEAQTIVQRQLADTRVVDDVEHGGRKRSPFENYIRKVSACLGFASSILWPDEDHVTLYTFRHQARADFVAAFGEPVAAAMLGHGTEVGRKFYTPAKKAGGRLPAVRPGEDVLARARWFDQETSADRIARKPWLRAGMESIDLDDQPPASSMPSQSSG